MNDPQAHIAAIQARVERAQSKALRNNSIGMWIGGVLFIVIAIAFGLVGVAMVAKNGFNGDMLVFAILSPMFALMSALFIFFAVRLAPPPEWLRTSGIPGRATVVGIQQGGAIRTRGSSMAQVTLQLAVSIDGGPPYAVSYKTFPPIMVSSKLRVGANLAVKIDPKKRSRLLIEWNSL
jgi:hypothetical protein